MTTVAAHAPPAATGALARDVDWRPGAARRVHYAARQPAVCARTVPRTRESAAGELVLTPLRPRKEAIL